MYLYFDKTGTLKEIINDEALRQGNYGINKLYIYVDGQNIEYVSASYLLPNNSVVSPDPFYDVEEVQIPFDRKRDLRFFKYWTKYPFIVVNLDNEVDGNGNIVSAGPLDQAGTVHASLIATIEETGAELDLGELNFEVEKNSPLDAGIVGSEEYLSIGDYKYLKSVIDTGLANRWKKFVGTTEQRLAATKNTSTLYVDTTTGLDYIWNGSSFIALGEHNDLVFNVETGSNHINSIYYKSNSSEGTYYPTRVVTFNYNSSNDKSILIEALIELNLPYNSNYLYFNSSNNQLYYYNSGLLSLQLIGALQNLFRLTWDTDGYVLSLSDKMNVISAAHSKATNFIIFEFSGGDYDGRRYLMNYRNPNSISTNLVCVDFEIDTETGKVSQFEKFKIVASYTSDAKGTWTEVASDNVSAVDSDTFIISDITYNIPTDVSDLNNDLGFLTASSSIITTMQTAISGKQDALPSTIGNNNKYLHINDITGSLEWSSLSVPTGAFTYIGTTTTQLTDGSTTNPITISGESVTATNGNVVFYGDAEYVWIGSAWEELGNKNQATSSVLGNIKLGSDTTIDGTASKVYPIQLNSSGQAFVYVPWATPTDYVDLSSAQTITGVKTFSNGINVSVIDTGSSTALQLKSNAFVGLNVNGSWNFAVNGTNAISYKTLIPQNNNLDLGASANKWKDLYLSGNLSDGTNSIAVANIASKSAVNEKQDKITTGNINNGTIEQAIGFNNNGVLVRGSLPSGVDNISVVNALPSTSDAQNNILYKLNNDLYALTETEQATPVISYANGTITVTCDYDAETIELYANGNKVGTIDLTGGNN